MVVKLVLTLYVPLRKRVKVTISSIDGNAVFVNPMTIFT
jgi:hypothetical protein